MTGPAKKTGARANSKKAKPVEAVKAPPTEFIEQAKALPKPEDLPKGPYPKDVVVFTYQPEDGREPILLAMNGFEQPDKLWHFDVAQLPALAQTWKWMDRANIPKAIQRQALMLSDQEYFKMFDAWFDAMKASARGAVSSAK